MKTEYRIYAALAVLALLGGVLWLTTQNKKKEVESRSATAASADYPSIGVPKDDTDKLTKIEIKNADKSDVVLEKKGDAWEVVKPVSAKANAANVRSVLDNLKELKVKEVIDRGTASYDKYDLGDGKGVHVVAYKGADKALDMVFGKSGSRGQMARITGKDGVWVVGGYSAYLYTREVKNWRETSILKFEDANVVSAEIDNKNGKFSFSKNDDKWSGTFTAKKDGKLAEGAAGKWEKLEESKIKDFLRAYKGLNAEDFADEKADTGLDKAATEGGVVKIKLKDNAGEHIIKVGKTAKGSSRYAIKEGGDGVVFVISSWSADWAVAEKKKFEKSDDKKKDDKKDDGHGHGDEGDMPDMPGMPEMPQMPE
jgi:hypothetical protein